MAFPPTDGVAKAEIRFVWNSQLVENVLHFKNALGNITGTTLADLANAIQTRVDNDWLPQMASTLTFTEVYVESYGGEASLAHTTSGGNSPGSATGGSMPGNATLCLSLRSGLIGRSRRGRLYTIGMTENHQENGLVTTAYRNAWLTVMTALKDAVETAGWELGVLSKVSGGLPRTTGLFTPVGAIIAIDTVVDSQRRRLQGRGR